MYGKIYRRIRSGNGIKEEIVTYSFQSVYFDRDIVDGRVIDIFIPDRIIRKEAVFFVHGGGWRAGTRASYHKVMEAFNKEGFICAATDYRLSNVNILDQITDVRHGYEIFAGILADSGMSPVRIFVNGSSAGAHLAALLTMAMPGECGESTSYGDYTLQDKWIRPIGASLHAPPVTFEPWEDIFSQIWTSMQNIVGVPYDEKPELYRNVSPVNYLSKQTPPIFLLGAENEHLFPLKHNLEFAAKAKSLGCRVEDKVYNSVEHGFFYGVTRRQQKEAFSDVISFIESL